MESKKSVESVDFVIFSHCSPPQRNPSANENNHSGAQKPDFVEVKALL